MIIDVKLIHFGKWTLKNEDTQFGQMYLNQGELTNFHTQTNLMCSDSINMWEAFCHVGNNASVIDYMWKRYFLFTKVVLYVKYSTYINASPQERME